MKKRKNPDKINLLLRKPEYSNFMYNEKKNSIKCNICNSEFRSFKSDIDDHLKTKKHVLRNETNSGRIIKYFANNIKNDKESFNLFSTIHLIKQNIPLTSLDNLFTNNFLYDLKNFELYSGKYLQKAYIDKSYDYIKSEIKKMIFDKPFSILIDESFYKINSILLIGISTSRNFFILKSIVLKKGISINNELLFSYIEDTFKEFHLERKFCLSDNR